MAEHKLVINLATKQATRVPLTPADIAQRAVDAARPPKPHEIKYEANTRILKTYSDWDQQNMAARQSALMGLNMTNGALTPTEQTEWDELQAAYAWIKAMHDAVATLQAMTPIPQDYQADKYWP